MADNEVKVSITGDAAKLKAASAEAATSLGKLQDGVQKGAGKALDDLQTKFGPVGAKAKSFGVDMSSVLGSGGVLAGAAAAGGAAIGAFAIKAVGQFQDLALQVDNFRQKSGATADQASRWIEVSNDLGVNADTVAGAFGRVNREAASGALKQYGVTAQDASGQFQQLLTFISQIPDENTKSAVAFKTLGKSWQELAPLLDTTENLGQRLQDVSKVSGKIISDQDIAQARKFRDQIDDLNDKFQGFTTQVGESIVPVLSNMLDVVNDIGTAIGNLPDLGPVGSALADIFAPFKGAANTFAAFGAGLDMIFGGGKKATEQTDDLAKALQGTSGKAVIATGSTKDATSATIDAAKADEGLSSNEQVLAGHYQARADAANGVAQATAGITGATKDATGATMGLSDNESILNRHYVDRVSGLMTATSAEDAHTAMLAEAAAEAATVTQAQKDMDSATKNATDAFLGQIDALHGYGDSTESLNKAENDFNKFLTGLPAAITDAKGNQEALNDVNFQAIDLSKQQAQAYIDNAAQAAKVAGATYTAKQQTEDWNGMMLQSVSHLNGPVRQAVIDYIAQTDGIPAEKMTAIQAAIEAGDIPEAERLLDEASATRTAAINADANTSVAEAEIDYAARTRYVYINAITNGGDFVGPGGGLPGMASGGTSPGGWTIVGEDGPELAQYPSGAFGMLGRRSADRQPPRSWTTIYTASDTSSMLTAPSGGVGSTHMSGDSNPVGYGANLTSPMQTVGWGTGDWLSYAKKNYAYQMATPVSDAAINATMGPGAGPQVLINITAGIGTDGGALGKAVVDALRVYERTNGAIPITVKALA